MINTSVPITIAMNVNTRKTNAKTKKALGVLPPYSITANNRYSELIEVINKKRGDHLKHSLIKNNNLTTTREFTLSQNGENYKVSPVQGGAGVAIYPVAPNELLEPNLSKITGLNSRELLIYYFEQLYPMTKNTNKWSSKTTSDLQEYYDNLQFWYIFNNAWTSSPMPVTLSDNVYRNWEKCTFYQANTIVQSPITSWGLAWRGNNGPQDGVKPKLTFKTKGNVTKTISTVTTDKDFWQVTCGDKVEITSWGWNPYPFGIYSQGPFNGSGNFLQIPRMGSGGSIVGTSHWDIILKCKQPNVPDSAIWATIFNHELQCSNITWGGQEAQLEKYINNVFYNVSPLIVLYNQSSKKYSWTNLTGENNGGYTPFLVAYFLYFVGGFGGVGGKLPFDDKWNNTNYQYAPLYILTTNGNLVFPEDQSIPDSNWTNGFTRKNNEFWNFFKIFFSKIQAWDTNWSVEKWRHPVFYNVGVGPSVVNPSDALMMAYATGNFDLIKWNPWVSKLPVQLGKSNGNIDPTLCKFYQSPAKWSHYQKVGGETIEGDANGRGFPIGIMTNTGSGYTFVIRTQMPNVNYDICSEFADFRITIPGLLGSGSGDQKLWSKFFEVYGSKYMFTADPDDTSICHNFTGKYAMRLPSTTLKVSKPSITDWRNDNNPASGKTFFDFNLFSGLWDTNPNLTGGDDGSIVLEQLSGFVSSGTFIKADNSNQNCSSTLSENMIPPAINGSLVTLNGNIVFDKTYSPSNCGGEIWSGDENYLPITIAIPETKYFPHEVDNFTKGVVGYQASGTQAMLGSAQTKWIMSSIGIPWSYSNPLGNRLLLLRGAALSVKSSNKNILNIIGSSLLIVASITGVLLLQQTKSSINKKYRFAVTVLLVILGIIGSVMLIITFSNNLKNPIDEKTVNDEGHRLRTYFALVYPRAPVSRWNAMSLDELRTFFCSLHWWYKGDGLPSPTDYIDTKYWHNTVPFGGKSSWKSFSTRKHCVENVGPRAVNEYDNQVCIGYSAAIDTTEEESPSAIIWTGRQLNSMAALTQQTTFFQPSSNYYIDTYNNFPSVNDTSIEDWENAKFVEIQTTWCPFPNGVYYDWAPGTGVWYELGKHIVGYTGLDLVRRLGIEVMSKKVNLIPIYQQGLLRTGIDNMTLAKNKTNGVYKIILDPKNIDWAQYQAGFGWYGSVILTNAQINNISATAQNILGSTYTFNGTAADDVVYTTISNYVKPEYLIKEDGKWIWSSTLPTSGGYIKNYPLPLPYFATFQSNGTDLPEVNPLAISMPWKYQLFNICEMMRGFCIDLLFLDESLINPAEKPGTEYVEWLIENKKKPLSTTRRWGEAIEKVNYLLSKPYVHPIFMIYPRVKLRTGTTMGDGPQLILETTTNPDLLTIQSGSLDGSKFPQNTNDYKNSSDVNGGVVYSYPAGLPQLKSADLEIDPWLQMLGEPLEYQSCLRINHWCGNKSLTLDIEIVNISQIIKGDLISNMPQANMYEIWKNGSQKTLSIRDPFADDSHVYFDDGPVSDIRRKYNPTTANSRTNIWIPPPWITYLPNGDTKNDVANVYGWPSETLSNHMITLRLSYCPINSQQIALSGSYPEYNKIIFDTLVRNKSLLS